MIELKKVYYRETTIFKDTEIHFTYKNRNCIYTILEYKENNEVMHFISYGYKHFNDCIVPGFVVLSPITISNKDIDFIKAFNKYFDFQIKL